MGPPPVFRKSVNEKVSCWLQEEEAQSKALDMLLMKKNPAVLGPPAAVGSSSKSRDSWALGEDWVITDQGLLHVQNISLTSAVMKGSLCLATLLGHLILATVSTLEMLCDFFFFYQVKLSLLKKIASRHFMSIGATV